MKAHFYVHIFVSGNHQMCSLLYSVGKLHHVYRVNAEEDVQDFRQLRPGLDPPQVAVLFLCSERALHRCRPHPGKFLSDKVFPFFSSLNGLPRFTNDVCIPFSVPHTIGLTYDLTPRRGLILFLASPKISAIACGGSSFFILPNSLFSNVDLSRSYK